jgi:hypothetical protein
MFLQLVEYDVPSVVQKFHRKNGIVSLEQTVDPRETTVIAIPTAKRPELLALTLEKLSQSRGRPEVHIYADSVDEIRLREIEVVRDLYLPEAFLFHAAPHTKAPSGCWNILNAIKSAAKFAEKVYLVEEDVLVYPYFFDWHESQTAVASCGRYHYDTRWKFRHLYTNPGSCLRRPLLDALVPHIRDEYFLDTRGYLDRTFGPWHEITHLDDGLIRNVMRANDWLPVYPEKPVCAHVGFRGYGQLDIYQNNETDLQKRIERARELIANPPQHEVWAKDWEPYRP